MNRSFRLFFSLLFACVLMSGCGGEALTKAKGELRVNGELVDNGTITFYPVNSGRSATAFVESDGTFIVSYRKPGDGLPPGDYKVAIIADKVVKSRKKKQAAGGEDFDNQSEEFASAGNVIKLVPQIYNNIQTTPLTITVDDREADIKLDIETK